MQAGLTIHGFDDKSFDRLEQLARTTYPGREVADGNYLEWEYVRNPDGNAVITVAENEKGLVAQYLVLPRHYRIGGNKTRGSLSVNTLTHPDFRGKNLFPLLAEKTFASCAEQEIQFTIGFPNPVSSPVISRKKIFTRLGFLELLIKPLRPVHALTSIKRGNEGMEVPHDATLPDDNHISFFDVDKDAAMYADFTSHFNANRQNLTDRTIDYIRWRFYDIPRRKYLLIKYVAGGKMEGFAAWRVRTIFGMKCLVLVDLCVLREEALSEILDTVHFIARKNSLDMIITALPAHSMEYRFVRSKGYSSLPQWLMPQRLEVIFKTHTANCPKEAGDFTQWFLTFGDYDIF